MFIESADVEVGECVWLFTGVTTTDEELQAYLDSIAGLLKVAPPDIRPAGIQVVDPGSPLPNA